MAITSYPFEDQDTTESQFSALFRELQDTGVVGGFGSSALRVTADSTGMNVKVSAGPAIVRGHMMVSTATETLPVTAAAAQGRIDRVILRLDPAANAISLEVKPGAPAASNPAAPVLTRTDSGVFEEELAQINIGAGVATIAAGAVLDRRRFIGHRPGTWDSNTRPIAPRPGQLGFNMGSGRWEYRDGGVWSDLLAWGALGGKPSTFPPSAHKHSAADIDSGTLHLNRLPEIPYSKLAERPFHTRTTGVTVGLGGTMRTVTLPAGRFDAPPVVQISVGNQTGNSNVIRPALGAVTKDYVEYVIRNEGSTAQTCTVNLSAFPES